MKRYLIYFVLPFICLSIYAFRPSEKLNEATTLKYFDLESLVSIDFSYSLSESTGDIELKAIINEEAEIADPKWVWKIDGNELGKGDVIHIPLALGGYDISLDLFNDSEHITQITKTVEL